MTDYEWVHTRARSQPILGPRFELKGELGRGGMGVVYRARDLRAGRDVAIKMLHDAHPEFQERLLREARAAATLCHPGVVKVHDVLSVNGRPGVVFELVEDARPLTVLLRAEIPLGDRLELALQVARAVEHAHDQGVVHRDIKPENVLVDSAGRARLTDFGLVWSQGVASLTASGALLGTPNYMAPEQLGLVDSSKRDPRVDVWALGVLLYEACCLRLPFEATSLVELIANVQRSDPPPFDRQADVSPHVQRVIRRALRRDPARRFPDAGSLAEALERALAPPKRSPRRALLGFLASLLVIALGGLVVALSCPEAPAESLAAPTPTTTPTTTAGARAAPSSPPTTAPALEPPPSATSPPESQEPHLPASFYSDPLLAWVYKDALAGSPDAMSALASFILGRIDDGPDSERMFLEAERWCRAALEIDPQHVGAASRLGTLLCNRRRDEEALPFLERVAFVDVRATSFLGMREHDPKRRVDLLRWAAERGSPPAQITLGLALVRGEDVAANPAEGLRLLRTVLRDAQRTSGIVDALRGLVWAAREGLAGSDLDEAMSLLRERTRLFDPDTYLFESELIRDGIVPVEPARGRELLSMLADPPRKRDYSLPSDSAKLALLRLALLHEVEPRRPALMALGELLTSMKDTAAAEAAYAEAARLEAESARTLPR